jgi:DNA polymerase III alpha subunit
VTYDKWAWEDFLLFCSPILNKTTVEAFIEVGCFDYMVPSRNKMLHEYETLKKLRGKELSGIQQKYLEFKTSLTDCIALILQDGSGKGKSISSVVRKAKLQDMEKVLRKPPRSLVDTPEWVAGTEESLLGISITYAKVDSKDIGAANCTCKDFRDTIIDYFIIAGEITNVNEVKTKRGKNPGQDMAFLTVNDSTGALDNVVVFPESWENNKSLLIESNLVMIGGKKGKENSFILEKVWQI